MPPKSKSKKSGFLLKLEDFAYDAEHQLGRANGNIFQRISGAKNKHDGQIMVRLKQKRFLILDYSLVPTDNDIKLAAENPFIKIPSGAGKSKCTQAGCTKIGVPVCLYDSDPTEPDSLYTRSGLCFTCQRLLNEKRRTERKRPPGSDLTSKNEEKIRPNLIYALNPTNKKFKLNGSIIELNNDAIIINGTIEGMKNRKDGYTFQEIGADLYQLSQEAAVDAANLVYTSTSVTAAAAVAVMGRTESCSDQLPHDPGSLVPSDQIDALYQKAFQSLNKSIFLLSQWKSSWDAAHGRTDVAPKKQTVAGHAPLQGVHENSTTGSVVHDNTTIESTTFDTHVDDDTYGEV